MLYPRLYPFHCTSVSGYLMTSWWHHQMETFSVVLALSEGNPPVTGEFPSQKPVTRIFDVFFDLCLSRGMSKQSRRRWFQTSLRSLWRHWNAMLHEPKTKPLLQPMMTEIYMAIIITDPADFLKHWYSVCSLCIILHSIFPQSMVQNVCLDSMNQMDIIDIWIVMIQIAFVCLDSCVVSHVHWIFCSYNRILVIPYWYFLIFHFVLFSTRT